ncbi:hypothetical protein E2C01_028352 [Portunus trituberculatus]|uniref:Uncharacterized protein n=1 Tax=Portunus trituberculatus TaxID=210409 RepID=A0A5B7ENU9_PORTR|nr:hypothetical protein [Portunus trituberculatus]
MLAHVLSLESMLTSRMRPAASAVHIRRTQHTLREGSFCWRYWRCDMSSRPLQLWAEDTFVGVRPIVIAPSAMDDGPAGRGHYRSVVLASESCAQTDTGQGQY